MAKFDPLEFNYELSGEQDGIFHFQKVVSKKQLFITDIFELAYHSKKKTWLIFIESINLNQFLEDDKCIENNKIYLFAGEIKNDFDFRFLITKTCKDPKLLMQLQV